MNQKFATTDSQEGIEGHQMALRASGGGLAKDDRRDREESDPSVPAADIAAYMVDMLLELRALAEKSGFETLGRVLEIAENEAKLRVGDRR